MHRRAVKKWRANNAEQHSLAKVARNAALRAKAKGEAAADNTYIGKPCLKCEGRERYVRDDRCCACRRQDIRDWGVRRRKKHGPRYRGSICDKHPHLVGERVARTAIASRVPNKTRNAGNSLTPNSIECGRAQRGSDVGAPTQRSIELKAERDASIPYFVSGKQFGWVARVTSPKDANPIAQMEGGERLASLGGVLRR